MEYFWASECWRREECRWRWVEWIIEEKFDKILNVLFFNVLNLIDDVITDHFNADDVINMIIWCKRISGFIKKGNTQLDAGAKTPFCVSHVTGWLKFRNILGVTWLPLRKYFISRNRISIRTLINSKKPEIKTQFIFFSLKHDRRL